jgi:hypothetical protein
MFREFYPSKVSLSHLGRFIIMHKQTYLGSNHELETSFSLFKILQDRSVYRSLHYQRLGFFGTAERAVVSDIFVNLFNVVFVDVARIPLLIAIKHIASTGLN